MPNQQPPLPPQKSSNRFPNLFMGIGLFFLLSFLGIDESPNPNRWLSIPPNYWVSLHSSQDNFQDSVRLAELPEKQEDTALKTALEQKINGYGKRLNAHLYYLNLNTGQYVDIQGAEPVAAASVIKLPILMEYFRSVGEGKLKENDPLLYADIHQAGGSGDLQYKTPGIRLPSLDLATHMIQVSDNTATNIFIDTLGGSSELDEKFRRMGLASTAVRNWLPDLTGTNTISTRDIARVLYNIAETNYLSPELRDQAIQILEGTHNRRLIPAGLPPKTLAAHKTGDIGTSLGDSALVMLPNGQKYLLCIQVERPYNDYSAKELIIELSRSIYLTINNVSEGALAHSGKSNINNS